MKKSNNYLEHLKECTSMIQSSGIHATNTGGAPVWVIKKSQIHGEGIIANKSFNPGDLIDLAFVKIYNTGDVYKDYRITPFGRHLNHSNSPNAETNESYETHATKKIEEGEEIAINYKIRTELEQPQESWK